MGYNFGANTMQLKDGCPLHKLFHFATTLNCCNIPKVVLGSFGVVLLSTYS